MNHHLLVAIFILQILFLLVQLASILIWRKKLGTLRTGLGTVIEQGIASSATALALLDKKIENLTTKIDGLVQKFATGQPLTADDVTAISNANAELKSVVANMAAHLQKADQETGVADPTSISATPNTVSVVAGSVVPIKITDSDGDDITAEDSTSYISDTPSVATCDKNGVAGVAQGNATIAVKDSFGNQTSIGVTVTAAAADSGNAPATGGTDTGSTAPTPGQ